MAQQQETRPMRFPPVRTKKDFVRRYSAGEFGNAAPTWNTLSEFLGAGYNGLIHLRNRVADGLTRYDISANDVGLYWYNAVGKRNIPPSDLYISAMAPTDKTVLQGEVMYSELGGMNLHYTTVPKPMRDALRESSHNCQGVRAAMLLRYYLSPRSYDWLEVLLERYPDHVVEFSTYSTTWGTEIGYNTVYWEVRLY